MLVFLVAAIPGADFVLILSLVSSPIVSPKFLFFGKSLVTLHAGELILFPILIYYHQILYFLLKFEGTHLQAYV